MRCLGGDLKFHWVYNKSSNPAEGGRPFQEHKTPFDIDLHAFVRELLPPSAEVPVRGAQVARQKIRYIDATQYAIETSVKGTLVNYQVSEEETGQLIVISSKFNVQFYW